jgi:hypothetical protein
MSLKENVDQIKNGISSEERFFESFVKVERFYKKYKLIIIISVIVMVGYVVTSSIVSYNKEQDKISANKAYSALLLAKDVSVNTAILKEKNQELLDIFLYTSSSDNTKEVKAQYLKEIALFNKAIKNNDIKALDLLILNPEFILKDFAQFNKALIQSNKNDFKSAKETLELIPKTAIVTPLVLMLKHYLLTK